MNEFEELKQAMDDLPEHVKGWREFELSKPGPDPLYVESWRLAVQMTAPILSNSLIAHIEAEKFNSQVIEDIETWQAYFLEKLKGGTDGK